MEKSGAYGKKQGCRSFPFHGILCGCSSRLTGTKTKQRTQKAKNSRSGQSGARDPVDRYIVRGGSVDFQHPFQAASDGEGCDAGIVKVEGKPPREEPSSQEPQNPECKRAADERKEEEINHIIGVNAVAEILVNETEKAAEKRNAEKNPGGFQRPFLLILSSR
ncbi:hypothetical protein SDC9_47618 [bioreactor metagenome]|uniref:Uncharacterized protein n=1 Tax=bioreactor metagenome TaxID=1076179 RepID=A0A644WCZ7_9ZZZZ